jgi:hypothetical protein
MQRITHEASSTIDKSQISQRTITVVAKGVHLVCHGEEANTVAESMVYFIPPSIRTQLRFFSGWARKDPYICGDDFS